MSVQFGLATMRLDNVTLGYMQGVTIDFSFEQALLYAGSALYPVDVRTHTGTVSGNAEFADLNALGISKLLGGTASNYGAISITDTTSPTAFQVQLDMSTDNKTFRITLVQCRSTKLSFGWARDSHQIPNFDFQAFANTAGSVGTIILEDVS